MPVSSMHLANSSNFDKLQLQMTDIDAATKLKAQLSRDVLGLGILLKVNEVTQLISHYLKRYHITHL